MFSRATSTEGSAGDCEQVRVFATQIERHMVPKPYHFHTYICPYPTANRAIFTANSARWQHKWYTEPQGTLYNTL